MRTTSFAKLYIALVVTAVIISYNGWWPDPSETIGDANIGHPALAPNNTIFISDSILKFYPNDTIQEKEVLHSH